MQYFEISDDKPKAERSGPLKFKVVNPFLPTAGRQRHGFVMFEYNLRGKWLELFREIAI